MPHPDRPRILIDATPVTPRVDGLSIYIANLIKHLPEESFERFDYTVLLNPGVDWPDLTAAMETREMAVLRRRIAPIGPRRDLHMRQFLRNEGASFDLVHITSNNYPFSLKDGICTIHDVTFMTWFDRKRGIPGSAVAARWYMARVIRNALRNARAIITVSDATRQEIIRLFGATEAQQRKMHVIHEGWEHLNGYPATETPFPFERDGYLFFLGSHRIHKNLGRLLEAFRLALPHLPVGKRLVISGSSGNLSGRYRRLIDALNRHGERVVFTGYVPNESVRRLYARADATIFPSLSEGFGLPVLEAFHSGAPLLSSNTTALPEVAADAALYFDPEKPEDIATQICRFYAEPELAGQLRSRGRDRLGVFSWDIAAARTVALYQDCLADRD